MPAPRDALAPDALIALAKRERGALAGIFVVVPPEIDVLPTRALAFWAASAQHDALRDRRASMRPKPYARRPSQSSAPSGATTPPSRPS